MKSWKKAMGTSIHFCLGPKTYISPHMQIFGTRNIYLIRGSFDITNKLVLCKKVGTTITGVLTSSTLKNCLCWLYSDNTESFCISERLGFCNRATFRFSLYISRFGLSTCGDNIEHKIELAQEKNYSWRKSHFQE